MSTASENLKCAFTPNNILFLTEITCIFLVVCTSLLNLTIENGNQHLWTMLVTSSLALIAPTPKFRMPDLKDVKAQETTAKVEDGGLHRPVPPGQ